MTDAVSLFEEDCTYEDTLYPGAFEVIISLFKKHIYASLYYPINHMENSPGLNLYV